MKRSSKALRMAQTLAVVAVWAGLLGYVIPAAFSAAPTVSTTAASAASRGDAARHDAGPGSADRRASSPALGQHYSDRAMVRVMQAALRPRHVSVTLGRQVLSRDQAFASITSYRSVRPGTWTVRAAGAAERATTRVTLAAGSHTTLVVLSGHGHLLISVPGVPAEAGTVAAVGASGTGGATPKPGASPVPWLVLGGTGLLLALAGLARLRQLRWARRVAAHIQ
jgi:hypothetical protein